jgi:hypothetical protein
MVRALTISITRDSALIPTASLHTIAEPHITNRDCKKQKADDDEDGILHVRTSRLLRSKLRIKHQNRSQSKQVLSGR